MKTDPNRQTGRTTRMLDKAKACAATGRYTIVIAANFREKRRLEHLLPRLPNLLVETPQAVEFGRFRGLREFELFIDHHAIESGAVITPEFRQFRQDYLIRRAMNEG